MAERNPYLPYPVRIDDVVVETDDRNIKSFRLVFLNEEDERAFEYSPGQFAELSLAGKGEIPIGIASSPTEKGHLLFSVNKGRSRHHGPTQHAARRCHGRAGAFGKRLSHGKVRGKARRIHRRRVRIHDAALHDPIHVARRQPGSFRRDHRHLRGQKAGPALVCRGSKGLGRP